MPRKTKVFNPRQIKKWQKQLEQQVDDIEGEILDRMVNISRIIKDAADQIVPVDTGDTKKSYYDDVDTGRRGIRLITGYDRENRIDYLDDIYHFKNLSYPQFRNGKQPFWLHKAYDQKQDEIESILKRGWKK